jgi:protein-S-isoprenylcysteine O-methyltransferase Ste14
MFAGVILQLIAAPMILGSKWAFVLAGAIVLLFVIRTRLEDRTLRGELAGYREYAGSTRYRLATEIR